MVLEIITNNNDDNDKPRKRNRFQDISDFLSIKFQNLKKYALFINYS